MKKLLLILIIASVFGCEKDETTSPATPLVKCGTMHVTSTGGSFRYNLTGSLSVYDHFITSDTTFDIYENQIYRIYYKDTVIKSIDSVWYNPGGNWPNDSVFLGIDTTYFYKVIDHKTGTGSQSYNEILPSTIYDR